MTENDEKLAEEYYNKLWDSGETQTYTFKDIFIKAFLCGIAHERARSQKLIEPLIGMLEQSRNAIIRAFEQTNDQYYANIKQAIDRTLEAVNKNDR